MRELKFRAWDGVCFRFFDIRENCDCDFSDFYLGLGKETPIEQYTGLKDKNGKEIYDGDILREKWHDSDTHRKQDRIGKVEYFCDGYVCWFRGIVVALGMFPIKNIEVIGNIHENAELLD